MILVRSPLRITLGGGGTDLPSYYTKYGGITVSAAIDKFVYVSLVKPFDKRFRLKYSSYEECDSLDEIEHPIIREVLKSSAQQLEDGLEITTQADVPSGTGLGSSGAFTVALCRAVSLLSRKHISQTNAAKWACQIEIDILNRPVGKQDQYISAVGGVQRLRYSTEGVSIESVEISKETLNELEDNLLMFFTGFSRASSDILSHQDNMTKSSDAEMLGRMHEVKKNGLDTLSILEAGDLSSFAESLNEHWKKKRERSPGMSNANIDEMYELGMKNGALGGKLVGAGSGGFMMFFAQDREILRKAFIERGFSELPVRFSFGGVETLVR